LKLPHIPKQSFIFDFVKKTVFLFAWLFWVCSYQAIAQDQNGMETWLDYYHYHKLSGKTEFYNDGGIRFSSITPNNSGWWQVHLRPSVSFRFRARYDFRGGIGVLFNNNEKNKNPTYFEFRPWQGYRLYWPVIGKLKFTHYLRFEERFIADGTNKEFTFKGRYQASTNIPLKAKSITPGTYFIPISIELFLNLFNNATGTRNDKFRFTAGIAYRKTENIDFLIRGIFQQSPTTTGIDPVIRFTIKQRFGY